MPDKIADAVSKIVAPTVATCALLGAMLMGALRGVFLTKKEHDKTCTNHMGEIAKKLDELSEQLDEGNRRFANTERYVVAIASKIDLKPGDIPKI